MSKQEGVNTSSKSVRRHVRRAQCPRRGLAARLLAAAAAVSAVLLGGIEHAHAGEYTVYTTDENVKSSMALNPNDGYCSLAEAVASANAGQSRYKCPDSSPGSFQTINLVEAAGKSFANYPYKITSLTIDSPGRAVMLTSIGNSRGKINVIDSATTSYSGFVINSGTQMTFFFVDLTYTGTAGKRLVENLGAMDAYAATFSKGDVRSHQFGRGGAIYNAGLIFHLGSDVLITNNKAKRGGGIYNNDGEMYNLYATVSQNSATMAGGGIYNMSTAVDEFGAPSKGRIFAISATITNNSAPAGGGVFNRGEFDMTRGSITFNNVSGTGSGETFTTGASCDGAGAGILSMPGSSSLTALLRTRGGAKISNNTASGLGGGVYNAGIANLVGLTLASNRARTGAAVYSVAQGRSYYCQVGASGESATITSNTVSSAGNDRYSIVDGVLLDTSPNRQCLFQNVSASSNSSPTCNLNMVRSGGSPCPQ